MHKNNLPKQKISKLRYILSSILLAAVLGIISYIVYVGWLYTTNTAKDLAKPLEQALITAGATKQCETGDGGHGPDNFEPSYTVYLATDKNEGDAIRLITKAAADNGYTLTQASIQNHGPFISVADKYIDKWYFDTTSKNSNLAKTGRVYLEVAVNASGIEYVCKDTSLVVDANHSVIGVGMRLR